MLGLPPSGSWQDLKDHMREAGDVCYTDVYKDGTGVVEFVRYNDMKYALRKLNDSKFKSHEASPDFFVGFCFTLDVMLNHRVKLHTFGSKRMLAEVQVVPDLEVAAVHQLKDVAATRRHSLLEEDDLDLDPGLGPDPVLHLVPDQPVARVPDREVDPDLGPDRNECILLPRKGCLCCGFCIESLFCYHYFFCNFLNMSFPLLYLIWTTYSSLPPNSDTRPKRFRHNKEMACNRSLAVTPLNMIFILFHLLCSDSQDETGGGHSTNTSSTSRDRMSVIQLPIISRREGEVRPKSL